MAGSRYRKTARAHSAQKNLEIPLIYPRLWLQSKLVEKENEKREEGKLAGRNAQVDNCIWAVCVRKESFSHHLLQRTGGMLYMAMWDGKCLAGSSILWQSWGCHPLQEPRKALLASGGACVSHRFFMFSPLRVRCVPEADRLPWPSGGSCKCF